MFFAVFLLSCMCAYYSLKAQQFIRQQIAIETLREIAGGAIVTKAEPENSWILTIVLNKECLRRVTAISFSKRMLAVHCGSFHYHSAFEHLYWLREFDANWSRFDDNDLIALCDALPDLEVLLLYDTLVTDLGLESLEKLRGIRELSIGVDSDDPEDCHITEAGFNSITRLTSLRTLGASIPGLESRWLERISSLDNLVELNLSFTQLDDVGLRYVKEIPRLRVLYLDHTTVTFGAAMRLRQDMGLKVLELEGVK